MRRASEQGYILAGALSVLIALSLVATVLTTVSGQSTRLARREEARFKETLALQSGIALAASQIAQRPREAAQGSYGGPISTNVAGQTIEVKVDWETSRMDVGRAELVELARYVDGLKIDGGLKERLLSAVRAARAQPDPIRLVSDLVLSPTDLACAEHLFTVFGGHTMAPDPEATPVAFSGQATPGSVLRFEASSADGLYHQVAVLRMMGQPETPFVVVDWRSSRAPGDEACDVQQN